MQLARVAGAQTGAFSAERIFVHKLSEGVASPAIVAQRQRCVAAQRGAAAKDRLKRRFLRRVLPFGCLFITLLFQLCVRVQMVHAGYRVYDLRTKALQHDNELRSLNARLAVATTPKNLVSRAQRELRLQVTPPQRIRSIAPKV